MPAGCVVHHRVKLNQAETEPAGLQHPGGAGLHCVWSQSRRDESLQCRWVQVSSSERHKWAKLTIWCPDFLPDFFFLSPDAVLLPGGCSKAVLFLGQLRLSCSEEQLLALIGLLTHSLAFGPISSWGTDVFIEIGVLAGILSFSLWWENVVVFSSLLYGQLYKSVHPSIHPCWDAFLPPTHIIMKSIA